MFHQSIDSEKSIPVLVNPTHVETSCLRPYNETNPRRHYNSYKLGDCGLAIAMTSPKRPAEKDGLVLLGRACSVLNYSCKKSVSVQSSSPLSANHSSASAQDIVAVESLKVHGQHYYGHQRSRPFPNEYCKTETTKVHITFQRVCISSLLVYRNRDVLPTICLDHRPEPALLGKVRSVLRNLKFPSMKLVSLQSSSP